MRLVGWIFACIVVAGIFVNASFMLVSPKAWFRLPSWLLLKGTLKEKKYAEGSGAIDVRLLGALMLGAVAWALHDLLAR
jgi:hypothetical protein